MVNSDNKYTKMQKGAYRSGTSNHPEHNDNPDYWNFLLGDLKDRDSWVNKIGLDFACGKGRNVTNMLSLSDWKRVDGIDISEANILYCKENYKEQDSDWYVNNGVDVSGLGDNEYDFIMSTIALQHIPVYDIRKSLITDLLRTLKPGGLFSFQMGYGEEIKPNENRYGYYENFYNAGGTNSQHDVRVQSEAEIIEDLSDIGFVNIETYVRDTFSDNGHPQWIYVKAYKSE
jgi:SAM-dependent methyltransferase